MDEKFKRLQKPARYFKKIKKSSNIKAKTLQKPGGENFFCISDRGWSATIPWSSRTSGVSKGRNLPCFWRHFFSSSTSSSNIV